MILDIRDSEKFYAIWWPLLVYVNNKFSISTEFNTQVETNSVLPATVEPIREKLWSDNSILESFISENPTRLSDNDICIVESWKHRIAGTFFVYRYLVKYTIFLDDKTTPRVYGVHGIVSPIEDILFGSLPVMVKTVLLPFKDKIIIDGILNAYNINFGSGYRSNLSVAYRNSTERDGIITSLIPQNLDLDSEQLKKDFLARNNLILKAFSRYLSKSGLSQKMVLQHTTNIKVFANEYMLNLTTPRLLLDIDFIHLMNYLDTVLTNPKIIKENSISFKRFIRFLNETGRFHSDDYGDIYDLLKGY